MRTYLIPREHYSDLFLISGPIHLLWMLTETATSEATSPPNNLVYVLSVGVTASMLSLARLVARQISGKILPIFFFLFFAKPCLDCFCFLICPGDGGFVQVSLSTFINFIDPCHSQKLLDYGIPNHCIRLVHCPALSPF